MPFIVTGFVRGSIMQTIVPTSGTETTWPIVPGLELEQQPSPPGPDGAPGMYPGGVATHGWPVNSVNPDVPYPVTGPYFRSVSVSAVRDTTCTLRFTTVIHGQPNTTYWVETVIWCQGVYGTENAPNTKQFVEVTTDATGDGRLLFDVTVPCDDTGWYIWVRIYDSDAMDAEPWASQAIGCWPC